mgnify:CR=1 FL=1
MKEIYEVRMHARAGQGAKSGSQLLAESAFKLGKWIQSFPEYGSERRGAPTVSYTRISDKQIRTHEPIVNPDAVLVFDQGIAGSVPVAQGLSEEHGILIVNTTKSVEEIKRITDFNGKIYTLDATGISLKLLSIDAPNVPMLGALIKTTNIVPLEIVEDVIKEHFLARLGEEKVKKNIEGLRKAWEEASS